MEQKSKVSKKGIIIAVIALVAAAGVFCGIYFFLLPATSKGAKTYTLTVVHADKNSKDFTLHTDEEYLGAALKNENLISGSESEFGMMVEVVDGERAIWDKDGAYWAFYIGEEYANTGVDATPVNDGDSFKLEYTLAS